MQVRLISAGMAAWLLASATLGAAAEPVTPLQQARAMHEAYSKATFDKGGALSRYVWLNLPAFVHTAPVVSRGPVRPLPLAPRSDVLTVPIEHAGKQTTLGALLEHPRLDGLVLLHGGRVVVEAWPHMDPFDRHLGWSTSKVFAGALLGILVDEGDLTLEQTVGELVPSLAGSAWAPVSLRNVLDMASGIDVYESVPGAYTDPEQAHYRFEEALGIVPRVNPKQPVEAVLAGFPAAEPAGRSYRYKSADTYVLGMVIESVTSKPYWQVLSERIWTPMGAAADALLWIDHDGHPLVAGGLYARLKDLARFGLAFTPSGRSGGNLQVVSEATLADLTAGARPELFSAGEGAEVRALLAADPPSHASWQWDMIWPDGDAFKGGYSGQGIFVSPRRDLVMVWYGTHDPAAEPSEVRLASVARQLSRSGLFAERRRRED